MKRSIQTQKQKRLKSFYKTSIRKSNEQIDALSLCMYVKLYFFFVGFQVLVGAAISIDFEEFAFLPGISQP